MSYGGLSGFYRSNYGNSQGSIPPPRLKIITKPTAEPLTVAQVVAHARLGPGVEDTEINRWIKTARQRAESYTGRRLMPQTWEYLWDYDFPGLIELRLPYPPLQIGHVPEIRGSKHKPRGHRSGSGLLRFHQRREPEWRPGKNPAQGGANLAGA